MVTRRGSMQALRAQNRVRVLELLQREGSLHRAEIARLVGVSRTTISSIAAELIDERLVVESDGITSGRRTDGAQGRKVLTLNVRGGVAVGIDISFERAHVVVAGLSHTVLAQRVFDFDPGIDPAVALGLVADNVNKALRDAHVEPVQVVGAGLGVPGPINLGHHAVELSSNSAAWVGVHAAEDLARRLGMPVYMDNTGHLGCLGEATVGAAVGATNVIYVKLATGVGCGLILNGNIFYGAIGATGEIGHMTVDPRGPACRCGNEGCLEAYAGIPAVLAALRPALGPDVTLDEVLRALSDGHPAAVRALMNVGNVLGRCLAGVCNLLNPELIVIGGELGAAGEPLLEPIRLALARFALPAIGSSVRVVATQLGDNAGAMGGVALVLQRDWLNPESTSQHNQTGGWNNGQMARNGTSHSQHSGTFASSGL